MRCKAAACELFCQLQLLRFLLCSLVLRATFNLELHNDLLLRLLPVARAQNLVCLFASLLIRLTRAIIIVYR